MMASSCTVTLCLLCVLFANLQFTQCSDILNQIYYTIPRMQVSHCVRRLNATHVIGCSSSASGNVGVVIVASTADNVSEVLGRGGSSVYILVIPTDLFANSSLMASVRQSTNINGLLVTSRQQNDTVLSAFSEDASCPNQRYSYYGADKQCNAATWNQPGNSYALIDWPFPVALLNATDRTSLDRINSCYERYNLNPQSNQRCALEIKNFMSAVGSAHVCRNRQRLLENFAIRMNPIQFCSDFSGYNMVVRAMGDTTTRPPKSVILVLARVDARSMFERSGFGASSSIPGLAVLVSVAVRLMKLDSFQKSNLTKDVLFAFIDNEAYDYLGSFWLLRDLQNGGVASRTQSPVNLTHLDFVVELGELIADAGMANNTGFLLLSDTTTRPEVKNETYKITAALSAAGNKAGISLTVPSIMPSVLPPSSVQTLLRAASNETPLTHVLITDRAGSFANQFYNSYLDTRLLDKGQLDRLTNLANALAEFLHQEATGTPMPPSDSPISPEEIVDCFVVNSTCSLIQLFTTASDVSFLNNLGNPVPAQAYTPFGDEGVRVSELLKYILIAFTGTRVNNTECPGNKKPYHFKTLIFNGSKVCYRTQMDFRNSFTPGDKDPDWPSDWPIWVISDVSNMQDVRLFLLPPRWMEDLEVALGVILTLLAALLAHLFNLNAAALL